MIASVLSSVSAVLQRCVGFALWVLFALFDLSLKLPFMDRVVAAATHFMTEHRGWVRVCVASGICHVSSVKQKEKLNLFAGCLLPSHCLVLAPNSWWPAAARY